MVQWLGRLSSTAQSLGSVLVGELRSCKLQGAAKREKIILFVDDVIVCKKTKVIYKNNPLALMRQLESDRTGSKSVVAWERKR